MKTAKFVCLLAAAAVLSMPLCACTAVLQGADGGVKRANAPTTASGSNASAQSSPMPTGAQSTPQGSPTPAQTPSGRESAAFETPTKAQNAQIGAQIFDVTYKVVSGEPIKLDIYQPTEQIYEKSPVLVYIHGGAWSGGDKKTELLAYLPFIDTLRRSGVAFVSVNYRLVQPNANKFPAQAEDTADALAFLVKNAEKYGFDGARIALMGASAGGHLALLTGLAGDRFKSAEFKDIKTSVRCIAAICAPTDLAAFDDGYDDAFVKQAAEALKQFIGKSFDEAPGMYELASPINFVSAGAPPVMLLQGLKDSTVPYVQAEEFYTAAKDAGMDVSLIRVQNAEHCFAPYKPGAEIKPSQEELMAMIGAFLYSNLLG